MSGQRLPKPVPLGDAVELLVEAWEWEEEPYG